MVGQLGEWPSLTVAPFTKSTVMVWKPGAEIVIALLLAELVPTDRQYQLQVPSTVVGVHSRDSSGEVTTKSAMAAFAAAGDETVNCRPQSLPTVPAVAPSPPIDRSPAVASPPPASAPAGV